jgi:hypothetical protein
LGVKWKVMRWLASRRNASRVAIDWRMPDFPFSPRSSLMPQRSATRRVTPSDIWVLRLSQTTFHGARSEQIVQERHEIRLGAAISDGAADLAGGGIERGDQGFLCHAGYTRTPAVRPVQASSVGSWPHAPSPGYRSSRRSRRSAHLVRRRSRRPDAPSDDRQPVCLPAIPVARNRSTCSRGLFSSPKIVDRKYGEIQLTWRMLRSDVSSLDG